MKKETGFLNKCWLEWSEYGFGFRRYECWHRDYISPIGIVWGMPVGGPADVYHFQHCYVREECRRNGVMTLIRDKISEHHRVLQTWSGSKFGGEKWLKASGWTFDKVRRDWFFISKKKR